MPECTVKFYDIHGRIVHEVLMNDEDTAKLEFAFINQNATRTKLYTLSHGKLFIDLSPITSFTVQGGNRIVREWDRKGKDSTD